MVDALLLLFEGMAFEICSDRLKDLRLKASKLNTEFDELRQRGARSNFQQERLKRRGDRHRKSPQVACTRHHSRFCLLRGRLAGLFFFHTMTTCQVGLTFKLSEAMSNSTPRDSISEYVRSLPFFREGTKIAPSDPFSDTL